MSIFRYFAKAALIAMAISLPAAGSCAEWPKPDVDKAVAVVDKGKAGIIACLAEFKTTIRHDVQQIDLNKDGVNELVVTSDPTAFGPGPSQGAFIACFGDLSTTDLMISDGKGGWVDNLGYNVDSLSYTDRKDSSWPDIALLGNWSCNPIYRYYKGEYGLWKTCDDGGNLIFADTRMESAVPRDFGIDTHKAANPPAKNMEGTAFLHNGSTMFVNPALGVISYDKPKSSIARTVHRGDVVFYGKPWNSNDLRATIEGTAYTFKKGCAPAPYHVIGGLAADGKTIVLNGAAPVRDKRSCAVTGYSNVSGNAHLEFSPAAPVIASWAGDYYGTCGNDDRVQCLLEITDTGNFLDVSLVVANRSNFNDVKCKLTGQFAASPRFEIFGSLLISGRSLGAANVSFRQDGGTLTLSGLPKKTCGVKLSGIYQAYGD